MSTAEFVADLRRAGVELRADGDQLRYDAPRGALTPDLRARLVERKVELLAFLRQAGSAAPIAPAPAGPAPLSFGQEGVWLRQQLDPADPFYNMPMPVRMDGALDRRALRRSLSAIVRRHAILRTTFHLRDGAPVQVAGPPAALALPLIDLAALPASRRASQLALLIGAEARRPFDLARQSFRAVLLRLAEREHVLLPVAHHLVFDNLSGGVLIDEMRQFYAAHTGAQPAPPPDLPLQYADFACWRQAQLTDAALADDLAYWRAQLRDAPTLALPADFPRPAIQTFAGARQTFVIPRRVTARLVALGRESGATLFMTVLAALSVLLARYAGQDDLTIGTSIANRRWPQVERMIGLFADVLALRADLSGDPSFRALLDRTRRATLDAYARQDAPFERVVRELRPQRDPGYNPLFQAFFSLHGAPPPLPELPGLRMERMEIETGTVRYDLDFSLIHDGDRLIGRLEYNTSLFRDRTATRLIETFQALLDRIAADPDRPISALDLLTDDDRRTLQRWSATAAPYPADMCLHDLAELQAAQTPDRAAVIHGGAHLSYAELNRRANQLAWRLRALGAGPDATVAIYMERSIAMVIAVLGVLKAGSAYVPLDPSNPAERNRAILAGSRARVFVTKDEGRRTNAGVRSQESGVRSLEPGSNGAETSEGVRAQITGQAERRRTNDEARSFVVRPSSLVDLGADWPVIAAQRDDNPAAGASPDNLAYVLHTSGSTGSPKGVALAHRPLMNLIAWHFAALSRGARTLQFASLGFDVSFHEIFSVCGSGGALCIIDDAQRVDIPALARFLYDYAIEKLTLPILVIQQLAETFHDDPRLLGGLRDLIATGEQLVVHPPLAALIERLPRCTLHNHYGPSETHLVTTYPMPRPPRAWEALPPIGRPIANVEVHLLDRRMRPVPIGAPGELYFGGVCLARGYFDRPDLTAAVFVPNPFTLGSGVGGRGSGSQGPGADPEPQTRNPEPRLYRTGDLARYREDGQIEFLGRIDRQVKIRGYRVEPGEVEAALRRHAAVRECVVLLRADAPGDARLVAYVVTSDELRGMSGSDPSRAAELTKDQQPTNDDERSTTNNVPSSFVLRPSSSPAEAADSSLDADASLVTRHSSLASELRSFLAAQLPAPLIPGAFVPVERIPLNASGKIDWRLLPAPDAQPEHWHIPPRSPIERRMAALWAELLHIDALGIDDNFFALGGHSLKAAALVARIRQEFGAEIRLREVFAAPTIRRLAEVIARARPERFARIAPAAPRDAYPTSSAQKRIFILQQIDPASMAYNLFDAFLVRGDLRPERVAAALRALIARHEILRTSFALTPAGPAQRIHAQADLPLSCFAARERDIAPIARCFFAPFDLARPPLLRLGLVRLSDSSHILLFDMHHIAGDGVSLGILIREFVALYEGRALAPPQAQYKDYAAWHNALIESGALRSQEQYWLAQFADGAPVLNIPTDYPRPMIVTSEGDSVRFTLGAPLAGALRRMAERAGVTLYMALFAAYAVLLARYAGQEDCVVGSPVAGRTHADLAGVVGMFVNMLAVRCRPSGGLGFGAFLEQIKTALIAALENQDHPFELLVEQVCRQRDASRNPLVETAFDLWRRDDLWVASRSFAVEPYPFNARTAKFDLLLDALDDGDAIQLDLQYAVQLFQRATIERMARHYAQIVAEIARDQDQRIGAIDLLTPAERQQILREFNAGAHADSGHAPIHRMIERQVAATPDAVAAAFGERQLTYAAMNARANQLARRLIALGLRRGDLAGVLLGRSTELIVAILAVFKAGGAYVPIDPAYPPQRIRFILDDLGAPALISERRLIDAGLAEGADARRVVEIADAAARALPAANLDISVAPEDAAYAIYTSGTSGRPKGVLVAHANIANAARAWMREYRLAERDLRVLQVASAAFDLFTGDLTRALTSGGRLIICPLDLLVELPELYRMIRDQRVSFIESTPSLVIPLMEYVHQQRLPIGSLEQLVIGSDILNLEDYARLLDRFGGSLQIINSYGVTEATVDSSYYTAESSARLPATVSQGTPIGRPFPNSWLYVLSARGAPQPIGVPGELCIGGAGVARGYLGRPDLTAARFVPNPFAQGSGVWGLGSGAGSQESEDEGRRTKDEGPDSSFIVHRSSFGGRLYRTGDHARWMADGSLEFLGRYDSQVKIGGYRVEIGEIETQLLRCEAVAEAVVIDCRNRIGQKYLAGYVTLRRPADPAAIRQHLLDHLPAYMVPGVIRVLEAIPLTSNGKIDRAALAERERSEGVQRQHTPPRTTIEAALIGMWQEILAVPAISVTDSFFELGGNSLSLLTLYNRVSAAYDAGLAVAELFSCHTIELLAARIERGARRPAPDPADQLEQRIFSILDDLESGRLDLADADAALERLLP